MIIISIISSSSSSSSSSVIINFSVENRKPVQDESAQHTADLHFDIDKLLRIGISTLK